VGTDDNFIVWIQTETKLHAVVVRLLHHGNNLYHKQNKDYTAIKKTAGIHSELTEFFY
jgi:hypothetical protein